MRRSDLRLDPMLRQRRLHARNQVAAINVVIGMLELAPAAFGKVSARRLLVVRTWRECSIVEQGVAGNAEGDVTPAWRHAVTPRRNADDQLVHR